MGRAERADLLHLGLPCKRGALPMSDSALPLQRLGYAPRPCGAVKLFLVTFSHEKK